MGIRTWRWLRPAAVWAVVVLISLDSALACRLRGRRGGGYRPAPGGYVQSYGPSCEASRSPIQKGSPGFSGAIDSVPEPPRDLMPQPPVPVPSDPPPEPTPREPAPREPAPATPAVEPAPPEPAPPKPPAPAPAARPDNFDDLFPPATPKPAETPKPAVPAPSPNEDDPFAPPAKPAAAPAVDNDPFAPAPAKPAAQAKPPAVDDDPFAPLPEKPAAPAKPATVQDDPFQISAEGTLPVRLWVDDTGLFRVRGRLVAMLDGKVRILKETGRTTTVPLERLSQADRDYVEELITRYGRALDDLLAAR